MVVLGGGARAGGGRDPGRPVRREGGVKEEEEEGPFPLDLGPDLSLPTATRAATSILIAPPRGGGG